MATVGVTAGTIPSGTRLALIGITSVGAVARFGTLDRQSLWLDELVTGWLLQLGFTDMLDAVPSSERTPYLYYLLAWVWTRVFGDGEVGLRSLSALAGTLTIPVAYAAASSLVSRRAGLVAAALVACNPFLIWYSQEARSYALVSLATALSFLFFARSLEHRPQALLWWALASTFAIATHYFALFVVAAEAVWLLTRPGRGRATLLAATLPAAVGLAHVGLASRQAAGGGDISSAGLATRVVGVVKNLIVGYSFPAELVGTACAAGLVVVALVLVVTRASPRARAGAGVALGVAAAALLVPVAIAVIGPDYVIARNGIVAVVPALVGLSGGYAASRIGLVAAGGMCAISLAVVAVVVADPGFGRTDWRGAARALRDSRDARAVVVTPSISPELWRTYLPALDEPDGDLVAGEIVVLALATEGGFGSGAVEPPPAEARTPPPGFVLVDAEQGSTYARVRYVSPRPVRIRRADLERLRLTGAPGRVFLLPGRRPGS